ncbi:hypothetical protein PanWU01x14_268780 [Parasponia andersonii]|uniref:Uncharacterized protein n=1 Tax=Parasponia andersonii TaxID=3476 RepID=A0A2P5B5Z0_PARAD|nr:hypothetical protein PanWU01x14_268780 [Parasponia andersonii]
MPHWETSYIFGAPWSSADEEADLLLQYLGGAQSEKLRAIGWISRLEREQDYVELLELLGLYVNPDKFKEKSLESQTLTMEQTGDKSVSQVFP